MKRKYLSALLMGTLTVASMSTFTSCKDYDDDISNLQGQIDKLATADQLSQKVSELQALISSNQSGISSLETKLAEVKATADSKATLDQVKGILADYATNENVTVEANKIVDAAIKALQEKDIAELKAAIETAKAEALKGVEEAKQANADVLKNLTENYSTTAETQAALNTAIEALKADNAKALKEAVDKIYKDLEAYAKQADLKTVADKVAEVEKALASKVDDKTLDTKVAELNKAIKDAKDENAGKIANLATTVKTAGENLTKVQQNLTNVENAVKTLGAGFDEKNTVAAAIKAIKTQLGTPDLKLGTLDERLAAIEAALKGEDNSDKLPNLKLQIETIEKSLKDIIGEYTTMVTSVELVASYSADNNGIPGHELGWGGRSIYLNMIHGLVKENSTFGDEVSDKIEDPISYVKGQDIKDDNSIIVRVNPVNAELTKNTKIVLLNSKGESLEDYVAVGAPSKFNKLITSRATSVNTGLWELPVHVAKGVSKEDFKKAVTSEDGKAILYAVAVKNTETQKDAQDRYVVSTYDVQPSYTDFEADKDFTFKVDGTSVNNIHNRWTGHEILGENARDYSTTNPESEWNGYGPATAPVYKTEGDVNKNVKNADGVDEVRYNKSLLQVEVGKAFTISDVAAVNKDKAADYYYVVLDKKNAIESGVSEINAWNSYDIKGLNKTVKAGEKLDLVINSKSANTDIIGFRVYAVNRDGKLLDPDGKAFYVIVGNAISGNIVGNYDAVNRVTDKKEFKFADGVYYTGWVIDEEASKDVLPFWNSETHSGSKPSIVPVYYKKDGKTTTTNTSEVAYVAFKIYDPQYIKNGGTLVLKNVVRSNSQYGTSYEVGTVRAMYTKVLPQAFPSDITFRPKQETVDGSGNFKAYMKPVQDYIVADAAKTQGTVDLDNIFYNLDANVSFNVKDAAKVNDKIVDVTSDDDHVLTINKDFIDSKTAHAITASYNFGPISCEQNSDGAWEIKNWVKTSNKSMNVTFACWESANSYAWVPAGDAAIKDANNNVIFAKKATQPQLQWSATGTNAIVKGEYIKTTNSYNTTYFGGELNKVLGEKKFLKVKANSAHLYYGAQEDPYFTVSVDANGNATFTQSGVQVENAPVADHIETLKFVVLDAFHHERTISLDVKILRPAAAAKRK